MDASLRVRRGDTEVGVYPIPGSAATLIGRSASNDVVLDHPSVSASHCVLCPSHDGQAFVLIDAWSHHGTVVDGAPFSKGLVQVGAVIGIGLFELELAPAVEGHVWSPKPWQGLGREPLYELARPGEEGRGYPLTPGSVTLVGRGPLAGFRLDDEYASGLHCMVTLHPDEPTRLPLLIDLRSSNGTHVNGRPIHRNHLAPASVLTVGESMIELRQAAGEPAPTPAPDEPGPDAVISTHLLPPGEQESLRRPLLAQEPETLLDIPAESPTLEGAEEAGSALQEDAPEGPATRTGMVASLRVRRGNAEVAVYPVFGSAATLIGRAHSNDLVLDDRAVSPNHCVLCGGRDGQGLVLIDARSERGTLVNGAPFNKGLVRRGAVLAIGPYELEVAPAVEGHVSFPKPRRGRGQGPLYELALRGVDGQSCPLTPDSATLVGRGPLADFRLDDSHASGIHCMVALHPGDPTRQPFVIDLHSSNGTHVDGRSVHRSHLAPGGALTIGQSTLELLRAAGAQAPRLASEEPGEEAAVSTHLLPPGEQESLRRPLLAREAETLLDVPTDSPTLEGAEEAGPLLPGVTPEGAPAANYVDFFGLDDAPFGLTADPDYFFPGRLHAQALRTLLSWLRVGHPVAVLVGPAGCGKSLLVASLARELTYRRPLPIVVRPGPELATLDEVIEATFARAALAYTGLPAAGATPLERWHATAAQLRLHNVLVAFLVDEAESLAETYLPHLAELLTTQPAREATRVMLAGRPGLRERVDGSPLFEFLGTHCTLAALGRQEIPAYVAHRFRVASGRRQPVFTGPALDFIAACTHGVPLVINKVADAALFSAFRAGEHVVRRDIVEATVRDAFGGEPPQ